jgi:hypothetical protein
MKDNKLSECQEALMKAILDNKQDEVETLLRSPELTSVNFVDENGMCPLSNACYKGNIDICKSLIERGADVNTNQHVHGYTPLMFAALGGHVRLINLLLDHGAKTSTVNSVGRTASQMAAFVGQHQAASVINNFISREDIEYFSQLQGLEKEPRLPPSLVDPFLSFVRDMNVNPVRVAMNWSNSKVLHPHSQKVLKVLELLCEKEMKLEDPNESLALKYHHLSFILKHVIKFLESSPDGDVTPMLKKWLRGDEHGFPILLEKFLRQSIREFPYRDCTILIQLVKTLSAVEVGSEPSALTILAKSINGQKGFDEDASVCCTCGESSPPKACSQCKRVEYCDQNCQKIHWFTHKIICSKLKAEGQS